MSIYVNLCQFMETEGNWGRRNENETITLQALTFPALRTIDREELWKRENLIYIDL